MAGGILALDLATVTGWACCSPEWRPRQPLECGKAGNAAGVVSGARRIAWAGAEVGPFLADFRNWLDDMLNVHRPAYVVFEAPILKMGETHIETARKLMCLAGMVELIAHDRRRDFDIKRVWEVNINTVKRHFAGNGHAKKREMLNAARVRGFDPQDDNEADALAVLDFSAYKLLG